jgi:hypothetical protein
MRALEMGTSPHHHENLKPVSFPSSPKAFLDEFALLESFIM